MRKPVLRPAGEIPRPVAMGKPRHPAHADRHGDAKWRQGDLP
jgi:hypothetical protein